MIIGPRLTEFLDCVAQVRTEADLHDLMAETTRRLGFEQFALVSHVDLVTAADGAIAISNYKPGWVERILSQRYYLDDPVHAASTGRTTPFAWNTIFQTMLPSRRQRKIMREGAGFGLRDGVTVPVHSPGEYRGTCSFGTDGRVWMTSDLQCTALAIAHFAFEAARMLLRARLGFERTLPEIPCLSPRQIDCVGLVASGKGDAQIAHMLGLSEATVHQHIGDAMRKYGVFKRVTLVVRALFDGQICLHHVRRTSSK